LSSVELNNVNPPTKRIFDFHEGKPERTKSGEEIIKRIKLGNTTKREGE